MKTLITYFAEFPKVGLLKVGSSINPERRLRSLLGKKKQLGQFRLIGATDQVLESDAHATFAAYRTKGEWYTLSASTRKLARKLSVQNWQRLIPHQLGAWFSKEDRECMKQNFPAKSYSASMQKMIQAILEGRIIPNPKATSK